MSKNFPVTTDRFSPSSPAPSLSSPAPTGDPSYDLLETKIPPVGRNHERNEKNDYISIDLQDSHPEVS